MDWSHFRDEATGRFKLRRLPAITGPVKVYDKTDLTSMHSEYRGMDWEEAKSYYEMDFSDEYCYDPEVEGLDASIKRGNKEVLGPLHSFKKCADDLFQLLEEWRQAPSESEIEPVPLDPAAAKKALKEGLIRPVVPATMEEWGRRLSKFKVPELKKMLEEHGLATSGRKAELLDRLAQHALEHPGAIAIEADYVATAEVEKALVALIERLLLHLESSLVAYPEAYQKAVWENLLLDWEHQDLVKLAGENLGLAVITQAEERRKQHQEKYQSSAKVFEPSDQRGGGDFAISISVSPSGDLEVGSLEESNRHASSHVVGTDIGFEYQGASDAAPRQRMVTTTRTLSKHGEIYLKGFCHDSSLDTEKSFRLDRFGDVIANIQTGEVIDVASIRDAEDLADRLRRWEAEKASTSRQAWSESIPGAGSNAARQGDSVLKWIAAAIVLAVVAYLVL